MSTLKSCFHFMLTLTLASAVVLAIPEAPPGYQIETVAAYAPEGLGQVRDLAIDPDGVIYVTHRGTESLYIKGSITRIDSTGIETQWKDKYK